jgi:ABC-2 type transport system permease protein
MKMLACFVKTFKENIRDWKILIIVIVFAPFFVYMMYMYLSSPATSLFNVAVLNEDKAGSFSAGLIGVWKDYRTEEGKPYFLIHMVDDRLTATEMIKNRTADLFITIPADFSNSFANYLATRQGLLSALVSYGDQGNIKYVPAASFIDYLTFSYVGTRTGIEIPVNITYESAGMNVKNISDFNLYVPALLVLSIIMMLFTAGASIIREVEKDTITRLALSRLKSSEFMAAISANQILIGITSMLCTLLAAYSVGYTTDGSILLLLLIGVLCCFAVIAISIITVRFIKNMFGLLTIGCFPFFILMFFSDCFMPLPKINIFRIFGNQVYLNDILPTATATRALNKILSYNSGITDIQFELAWMLLLSILYFAAGVYLFKRKYKY